MSNNDNKTDKHTTLNKTEGEQGVSRRKFLKNTGIAAGGLVGGALLGGLVGSRFETTTPEDSQKDSQTDKQYTEARMFFTRYEDFVVLEQATERIFPEDDHGPGAIELGVPYFIDKQLAGQWGLNAKDYRQAPFLNNDAS